MIDIGFIERVQCVEHSDAVVFSERLNLEFVYQRLKKHMLAIFSQRRQKIMIFNIPISVAQSMLGYTRRRCARRDSLVPAPLGRPCLALMLRDSLVDVVPPNFASSPMQ